MMTEKIITDLNQPVRRCDSMTPRKQGSLFKTAVVGLLILLGIALILGTLTVLFP